jgi:hypothetical protein
MTATENSCFRHDAYESVKSVQKHVQTFSGKPPVCSNKPNFARNLVQVIVEGTKVVKKWLAPVMGNGKMALGTIRLNGRFPQNGRT